MHQQFLRAIGVMTATGNAALKLNRIHYLRPTKPEAAQAANTNHSIADRSNHLLNAELTGTSVMPTRDMADSSSSRTDMTRMCLRWRNKSVGGNNIYVQ